MTRKSIDRWRLYACLGAMLALFAVVGYRVFIISYVRHAWYSSAARAHAEGSSNIFARGTVYLADRDGQLHAAATNKRFKRLTLRASQIPDGQRRDAALVLADISGLSEERIRELLDDESDLSVPVGPFLSDKQVAALAGVKIAGLDVIQQTDRYYPDGTLAADVIGFFGHDSLGRHGQYGVEAFYESELAGQSRQTTASPVQSLWEHLLTLAGRSGDDDSEPSSPVPLPADIVLTLDRNVQAHAQDVLGDLVAKYEAAGGSVVIQDVRTGNIVAMADSPSFDPNHYGSSPVEAFLNSPTQVPFEPGSSFKPFTMAAGLETGVITPKSTFTDTGSVQVAGYTIRNFTDEPFGTVTMTRVLEKSINTGTMHVQRLVGNEAFLEYLINFGFGQRTGADLPGEATGDIGNLYSGRSINFLTASFGQGIAVTPLQLAAGYSAIANGGKLMKPHLVQRVVRDGQVLMEAVPEVAGIPISPKTASSLRAMLTSVVDNGFDKARIARYDVAGKTGTAQIADPAGGYLEDEFIHSFAGFIPSNDEAHFTIVITLDRPRGVRFASDSLSPAFKNIALFLINYYRIPPTR